MIRQGAAFMQLKVNAAWLGLGQPCSYNDMVEATMQYGLVLVAPELLMRLRSPRAVHHAGQADRK